MPRKVLRLSKCILAPSETHMYIFNMPTARLLDLKEPLKIVREVHYINSIACSAKKLPKMISS